MKATPRKMPQVSAIDMASTHSAISHREKVQMQKTLIPSLYGEVDFSKPAERFTDDISENSFLPKRVAKKYRKSLLKNTDLVDKMRSYSMLGDSVADAYAALMPKYGYRTLITMLTTACEQGIEAVDDAPAELKAFISELETIPNWIDMDLVEKGARTSRIYLANLAPFSIRGAFVATFMNKYSGLPMALTGTLSSGSSAQRVNETSSFFTTAALPGSLQRDGTGFKAAAMVRLMHSMVRFNLLTNSELWDKKVYGIPIPQVDQMPAGTIPAFLTAFRVVTRKNKRFTKSERAIVELCRYQCYLLGLPADLLPATPQGIVDVMLTYGATLREGYDEATCGALVKSTLSAYRPKDKSLTSIIYNTCEKSFSRVFFIRAFGSSEVDGTPISEIMNLKIGFKDYLLFGLVQLYILPKMALHMLASRIPIVSELADLILVKKINKLLVEYGHPEYASDATKYKPTIKASDTDPGGKVAG